MKSTILDDGTANAEKKYDAIKLSVWSEKKNNEFTLSDNSLIT
jgi:hypothetical protein